MDSAFNQIWMWVAGLGFAICLPWIVVQSSLWIILRCGEARLRALPMTIWRPLYNKLAALSSEALYQLSLQLPREELYQALNPERCVQQTFKVLLPYTESLTDQLIRPQSPVIWDNLPLAGRMPIYQRVSARFKPCIDHLVRDMQIILTRLFNHQAFIADQMAQQESGYRFITTEALHQYWYSVHRSSRLVSLVCVLAYLLLALALPDIASGALLFIIPLVVTLIFAFKLEPLKQSQQKAFARCLGYWLGERIYQIDELVRQFGTEKCDQPKLRILVVRAFRPLIEDTMLKTLAQLTLGRHALLELRTGLVDYMMINGNIPFEHTQFKQERAIEISRAFESKIETMNINLLHQILKPTMTILRQLVTFICCSLGIFGILIYWYF